MNNREFDRCMRRMQKGDKTGLKEIYEAYISYIYAVIRGVVKNKENAEDLTADAASGTAGSMENDVVGRMNFRETVEKLPETERQIMTMKLAGQMTFKEIAEVLGIPMGTVTWKYQNSLEKLRRVGV